MYQLRLLADMSDIGEAGYLPEPLMHLSDPELADLSWVESLPEYAGKGFFAVEPPPPGPYVPAEVPMYKVRKLLIKQGLMATVEAAVAGLTGESGDLARVDWEYAPNLVRLSPLVQGLGAAIGLSSEEIDDLVVAAAALP